MTDQIEREIAHLDAEPLVLPCEAAPSCTGVTRWLGQYSCCGHDFTACETHRMFSDQWLVWARKTGQRHSVCGALLGRIDWFAVTE